MTSLKCSSVPLPQLDFRKGNRSWETDVIKAVFVKTLQLRDLFVRCKARTEQLVTEGKKKKKQQEKKLLGRYM